MSGGDITHNVIYDIEDAGVYFHCGNGNRADNNVFAFCGAGNPAHDAVLEGCNAGGNPTWPDLYPVAGALCLTAPFFPSLTCSRAPYRQCRSVRRVLLASACICLVPVIVGC